MAVPQLTLGSFNLTDWAGSAYRTAVMATGTSKGAPVPLEVAVKSWLQDGSIVVTQGYDNRTVSLRVNFRAASLTAVANAEAAFFAELGKPNLLTWTPATGLAAVFVVVTSSMEEAPQESGDLAENQAFPWRTYNVRLLCEAFTRSAAETVTAALATTGTTTTTVDACSATTGWTGTIDGGAVTVTGPGGTAIAVSGSIVKGTHSFTLQKTFATATTAQKYLVVDWAPPVGGISNLDSTAARLVATNAGVGLDLISEGPAPTLGYTRTMFYVTAASLTVTNLSWRGYFPNAGTAALTVDLIAVSDVNPITGTARQQLRSIAVGGSAPAPGNLVVSSSGNSALGDGTLVYVYQADDTTSGYTPPLRQFRSSGGTVTTNSALVSGASEPLIGGVTFDVPIAQFPRGEYLLMARLMTSGGGTPTMTYSTITTIGGNSVAVTTASTTLTITAAYVNYALGRIVLPTTDLDVRASGATVNMRLVLQSSAACTYDEVWLFNRTIGALIQVDCGSGTSLVGTANQRLLSIESPTVTTPRPRIRKAHSDNMQDSYGVAPSAWDLPRFKPPQVNVFYVTPGATNAGVTLTYFKRWHTNPAT